MHKLETFLLISAWILTPASLFLIPRAKAREAAFIFLIAQLFSWILGLLVVEFGLIEYPVHELSKANSTSFLFEYLLLPILAAQFILHYPSAKTLKFKILYYLGVMSVFTLSEFLVERYTLIIKYHGWTWYYTFISMSLFFYLTMVVYKWFYKLPKVFSL